MLTESHDCWNDTVGLVLSFPKLTASGQGKERYVMR
jgi:hypothetical protein